MAIYENDLEYQYLWANYQRVQERLSEQRKLKMEAEIQLDKAEAALRSIYAIKYSDSEVTEIIQKYFVNNTVDD